MVSIVEVGSDKALKMAFLKLPKNLYSKKEIVQDEKVELDILEGTHILSHYFETYAFLALDESGHAVSRVMLTIYPHDKVGYLGFFESINDSEACMLLLRKAEEKASELGCENVVGPVDASFWIRYRFKANHFENTYTGEPYNKDYYVNLWQICGYEICEEYFSNLYKKVDKTYTNDKFQERLNHKLQEGYVIKSPSLDNFQESLEEVYDLLIVLYKNFPTFKFVTKDEFTELFSYLKNIIQYDMIKLAYFEGKAVAFFITIPNYNNIVYGKLSLLDYMKIIKIRNNPKDYVMLYMGVDLKHKGLGKAMAEVMKEELEKKGTPSIGALIQKGKITKDYFYDLVDYEYNYYLLQKRLTIK